jgi:DNA-binding NarL/FixJ family response regulator
MVHGSTQRLVDNLRRAVAGIRTADDATMSVWDVRTAIEAASFLADDAIVEAEAVLDRVAASVAGLRSSAPVLQADLEHRRLMLALAKGQFEDVLAAIALLEQRTTPSEMSRFTGGHRFIRGWIALQRGQYAEAAEFLAERTGEDTLYSALGAMLAGEPERVVATLAAQGFSTDVDAPAAAIEIELEPHLIASHAYDLLGDRDSAWREAEREVVIRRRYGPKYRLAEALRRSASFEPARQAVVLLAEAAELAESTPRRPVTARVLASYGAALRRVDRIPEAREALYRAIDLAGDMGMGRLQERARRELVLAGGRPRRARTSGPEALTEAQQQVARLAATGCTNRQIAEELFVTIKTVETHLGAVYRKLGIRTREELVGALGTPLRSTTASALP